MRKSLVLALVGGAAIAAGAAAVQSGQVPAGAIAQMLGQVGLKQPAPTPTVAAPPAPAPRAVVTEIGGPTVPQTAPQTAQQIAQSNVRSAAQPVLAPQPAPAPAAAPAAPAAGTAAKPPLAPQPVNCPGNPNALGVVRTVEIDTTGGPGFGFEHFKMHDFLRMGEVVLTFDDGPWPRNTQLVLEGLARHCTKATFFPVGKHAIWHPEILKQVADAGHTIGTHTWSHMVLSKVKPEVAREEIEKGFSAVKLALGAAPAPFFRFPALQHPPEMVTYLGERNVGIFSTDLDSFDFKFRKPEAVVKSVMDKLAKHGKGIVLMHDFQVSTAQGIDELLDDLKAKGFRVVHLRASKPATTIAQYDEAVAKEAASKGGGLNVSTRPTSSVVRTIDGN